MVNTWSSDLEASLLTMAARRYNSMLRMGWKVLLVTAKVASSEIEAKKYQASILDLAY